MYIETDLNFLLDGLQSLADSDNCKVFQFELSTTLNTSSMSIFVYQEEASLPNRLFVLVSYSNSDEEKSSDQIASEVQEIGWNKLELPPILLPPSWNETFICSIEITGKFESQN